MVRFFAPQHYNYEDDHSLSLAKRAGLLNLFIFVEIAAMIIFIIVNTSLGIRSTQVYYLMTIASGLGLIYLNSRGYFHAAALVFVVTLNAMVFLIASSAPYTGGAGLHFISLGLTSVLFFYRDSKFLTILSISISGFLYVLCATTDYAWLPQRSFSHSQTQIIFFVNSGVATFCCVFCLQLVMKLNSDAKQKLEKNHIELLEQFEILKKTNAELDRFIYSASHDLRAPLSSIAGLIQLSDKDSAHAQHYGVMIKDRIQVMDRFITEIIDLSRNARLEVQNERIVVRALVDEIIELLRFSIDPIIQLRVDISSDVVVASDRLRLQVVLSNLISNAIKYSEVRKENPAITIAAKVHDQACTLMIQDNGIGIKPEHITRIFEMFYRATERSKGSGLGLYIVQETLEKIRGTIAVESEFGKGTTFTVTLPR